MWCDSPLQGQNYGKGRSFADGAGDVDAALVIFHDAACQGESEASAVAFRGVKRPKNVGQM